MYKHENHSFTTDQPTDMSTIPHVPIFIEDDDIENGSRIILKQIRPNWDLEKIRYKVNHIIVIVLRNKSTRYEIDNSMLHG